MAKAETAPCECSKFEATIAEQLTEDALASGEYDVFTTGCRAETRRVFAPGHDAKLKSALIAWGAKGYDVARCEGGLRVTSDAETWASKYEFGHMVLAGLVRAQEKAEAKAKRKASKATPAKRDGAQKASKPQSLADVVAAEEAKHAAEQAASRPAPEWHDDDCACLDCVAPAPAPATDLTGRPEVTAKVGRWEYRGVVSDEGTFYYLAKDGHTRKTAEAGKFAVVSEA